MDVGVRMLKAMGASDYEASTCMDFLVKANLRGHDSHGVIRLVPYIKRIQRGGTNLRSEIRIVREGPSTALIDGNWGLGQVVAKRGMEIAIEKAQKTGAGAVSIFNCCHVGRLADYAEMASDRNMIGFVVVVAPTFVAPYGGASRVLGTNPICFSIPRAKGRPIILDMATSVVASGKVNVKYARGEKTPNGWIIDSDGNPTNDPAKFFEEPMGALLPLGGIAAHKGYGLCLIVELLGGALSGAGCGKEFMKRGEGNGVFLSATDISSFGPVDEFKNRVEGLIDQLKASKKAIGFTEILVPGEPEDREFEKRSREGIFIEDKTWNEILSVARELKVAL